MVYVTNSILHKTVSQNKTLIKNLDCTLDLLRLSLKTTETN